MEILMSVSALQQLSRHTDRGTKLFTLDGFDIRAADLCICPTLIYGRINEKEDVFIISAVLAAFVGEISSVLSTLLTYNPSRGTVYRSGEAQESVTLKGCLFYRNDASVLSSGVSGLSPVNSCLGSLAATEYTCDINGLISQRPYLLIPMNHCFSCLLYTHQPITTVDLSRLRIAQLASDGTLAQYTLSPAWGT
ncbi:hypothetical protein J6590_076585 [Homalodisca vitripennis]|nr:hypothetical protein J6590_076585 [Homalodisca vitripennis]